jgi:acetyl-CoA acyltransferase 2
MAYALSKEIFVVGAKRTAFGAFGGTLKGHTANDLQTIANVAALKSANVDPTLVDTTCVGNVMQSSADAAYLARHAALRAGCDVSIPALTVNRLCGSGFEAVAQVATEIELGKATIGIAGGAESMSQAPYALRGARFGTRLGTDLKLEDTLWAGLTDLHIGMPMGITAENLAAQYGLTMEDCNIYTVQTQQRWAAAQAAGHYDAEICPVEIKKRGKVVEFKVDEHPKPKTTMESMGKLGPVFKKGGTVNAGNASGICDGAASLILASAEACKANNLTPLARVVGFASAGCDPKIMGIGPVPAAKQALTAAGLTLDQMDICEVNEAFAPQFLSVQKELGLDNDKTNMCGGAIALGHPLGASGARITGHLVHALNRTGSKYALGSACIGGGQGIAVILENAQ